MYNLSVLSDIFILVYYPLHTGLVCFSLINTVQPSNIKMDKEQLDLLKDFVKLCEKNTNILHLPELNFYRIWLEG